MMCKCNNKEKYIRPWEKKCGGKKDKQKESW